jgi:hypothetical protein
LNPAWFALPAGLYGILLLGFGIRHWQRQEPWQDREWMFKVTRDEDRDA